MEIGIESVLSEDIRKDLVKMEQVAARALERIESIYKEVMGPAAIGDSIDLPDRMFSGHEDNSNNTYCPNLVTITNEKTNNAYTTQYKSSYNPNKLCQRCHNLIVPVGKVYRPQRNHQCDTKHERGLQCQNCSGIKNKYILNKISKNPAIQHPNNFSQKISNDVQDERFANQNVHRCPLKSTVPEPFKMTLRETTQREIKALKFQQLKEKLRENAEKEMRKKISCIPVPGHIHLPLFQKMVEQYEKKKIQRKEITAQRLKDMVKPFNFSNGNKKELTKASSMPNLASESANFTFKAKPAPKNILSQEHTDKIKNREIVRRLRIAERAKEMLKQSSLPFSENRTMYRSSSLVDLKNDVKSMERKISKTHKKTCSVSREERKLVVTDWNAKVATMDQPNEHFPTNNDRNLLDQYVIKCKQFLASQSLPFYDLPIRMTTAAMLRDQEIRKELLVKKETKKRKKEEKWERVQKEKEIKKSLAPKLKINDPTLNTEKELEEKLEHYRESRILRQQEYEKELQEMMCRIQKQPLLIERLGQNSKKEENSTEMSLTKLNNSHRSVLDFCDENTESVSSQTDSS